MCWDMLEYLHQEYTSAVSNYPNLFYCIYYIPLYPSVSFHMLCIMLSIWYATVCLYSIVLGTLLLGISPKMKRSPLNSEIDNISLHNPRPILLHGYIVCFVPLYAIWFYTWVFEFGVTEYFEAGCIAVAIIGVLQVICCLFCMWFINFRCALTCSKVSFFCKSLCWQCTSDMFWLLLVEDATVELALSST